MTSRVAIYCRISSDKTGEGLGVARQEALCREYATAKGWTVAETLTDNDISATTGKLRPAFERLLKGLEDGSYDGLVVYHVDRLYRSLRDLARVLDLHKAQPFLMGTVSGDIDLATDTGRLMASILASVATAEVERKNQRSKDANKSRAHAGKTLSKMRVFGWEKDNITLRSSEADEIRSGYEGLLNGSTSLGEISRRWTALNLRTEQRINKTGLPASPVWTPAKVRGVFERQRNCGRAVHLGQVVGMGEWEPIVSEADHDLLQTVFAGRSVTRDNRRKHAISGLPICGKCGKGLFYDLINGKPHYVCKRNRGHLGISAHLLETAVEDWLKYELGNPKSETVQSLNLSDTLAAIRVTREALAALGIEESELGSADLPWNVIKSRGLVLASKRAELEAELASLMTGDRVIELVAGLAPLPKMGRAGDLFARHDLVMERWHKLSVLDQHLVLSTVAKITVAPGRGSHRVTISPAG